jgi:hypothetical protein
MSSSISLYGEAEVGEEAFYNLAGTDVVDFFETLFLEACVKVRRFEMGQPSFS